MSAAQKTDTSSRNWVIGGVLLGAIAYHFYRQRKKAEDEKKEHEVQASKGWRVIRLKDLNITGSGAKLSCGQSDFLAVTTNSRDVFVSTDLGQSFQPLSVSSMPGYAPALQVAAGADGTLVRVSPERTLSWYIEGKWQDIPTTAPIKVISVASNVLMAYVDMSGSIWTWRKNDSQFREDKVSVPAESVAIGADGNIWYVEPPKAGTELSRVFRRGGSGWLLRGSVGQPKMITASDDFNVYILTNNGALLKWNGTAFAPIEAPQRLQWISAGADALAAVDSDDNLFLRLNGQAPQPGPPGPTPTPTPIPVPVPPVVPSDWKLLTSPTLPPPPVLEWVTLPIGAAQTAMGRSDFLAVISNNDAAGGNVFVTANPLASTTSDSKSLNNWRLLPDPTQRARSIAASSDGTLFKVNADATLSWWHDGEWMAVVDNANKQVSNVAQVGLAAPNNFVYLDKNADIWGWISNTKTAVRLPGPQIKALSVATNSTGDIWAVETPSESASSPDKAYSRILLRGTSAWELRGNVQGAVQVSVGDTNHVFVLTRSGSVLQWNAGTKLFVPIWVPPRIVSISAGLDGMTLVNSNQQVFYRLY